ncbi:hypothetical protein PPL_07688 [Heterostelium album PN500]|uniref:Uncharacterized protein n=1 Tax=Heterostelium pallidum (strain ATCC 26659 / Pp 5 / PN500) TaxID=670386 RepID=D3BGN6_HETP5|nr:hypothetical protein PPL_07688 [Heterostelium album PN500]EFA79270.1 hypothetical protein PPL_07688 [Heterostelium album PN500]|eukprot:XP_020431391.1 hypothetical protein PPL_07688 [Heterostelium album PN500]
MKIQLFLFVIIAIVAISAQTDPCATGQASSISQWGITFNFDKAYPCGKFVNGDYWVTPTTAGGKVVISSMLPAFTGTRNGWMANPNHPLNHGFDSEIGGWTASMVPALPYSASVNTSIVKAISEAGANHCNQPYTCLSTAAVLTVLAAPPPTGSFRPGYYGLPVNKKIYSSLNMQTALLPSFAPVADTPTLASLVTRFERVQLDHKKDWTGRDLHPHLNLPDYGSIIASDTGDAVLRLMLNDPLSAKMPLLIQYVQAGIDYWSMYNGGVTWPVDGGIFIGRKLPIAFAAVMLNDSAISAKLKLAGTQSFGEDGQIYYSTNASMVLWGQECDPDDYWDCALTGAAQGTKDCRDPFGYIDGGIPGDLYQMCCTSQTWKATVLSQRLMPKVQCAFNSPLLLTYVDRWVSSGAHTLPDPYSLQRGGVLGPSRFPQFNGKSANDGYYSSSFAYNMWATYRATAPVTTCP